MANSVKSAKAVPSEQNRKCRAPLRAEPHAITLVTCLVLVPSLVKPSKVVKIYLLLFCLVFQIKINIELENDVRN